MGLFAELPDFPAKNLATAPQPQLIVSRRRPLIALRYELTARLARVHLSVLTSALRSCPPRTPACRGFERLTRTKLVFWPPSDESTAQLNPSQMAHAQRLRGAPCRAPGPVPCEATSDSRLMRAPERCEKCLSSKHLLTLEELT
jgi:hypothetical protein